MRFTVFTSTYNRGYIIENLYHSLQRQSFCDFEWVVVDDGSTDQTEALFQGFQKDDNPFSIRYIKTSNGGKHRAINLGVTVAEGELFFIVDSDDYLTDDALEKADLIECSIPQGEKSKFGGICGQRGQSLNDAIGTTFEGNILDITMLSRLEHGITGDKAEIFYTKLLKQYPFPEFAGENFITECVVWDKIAADGFLLRFYNKIAIICDYLPDGLTAKGKSLLLKNPRGYGLYLYQCGKYGKLRGLGKWNQYLEYYFALRKECNFFEISRNLCMNPLILWIRIFGLRLFYKLYNK